MSTSPSKKLLSIPGFKTIANDTLNLKVWDIRGSEKGPIVLLASGTHGNELNGVEVCRQLALKIEEEKIRGELCILPILSPLAFQMRTRLNPADNRDPSQLYPGTPLGTATEQLVYNVYSNLASNAEVVIDIHSGGIGSKNIPHIYTPSGKTTKCKWSSLELADIFGADILIDIQAEVDYHFSFAKTLASYSNSQGAAAFAPELGEGGVVEGKMVNHGIRGAYNVLKKIGMLEGDVEPQGRRIVTKRSTIVQSTIGGILERHYDVGDDVKRGKLLATVRGIYEGKEELLSPVDGTIQWTTLFGNVSPGEHILWIGHN